MLGIKTAHYWTSLPFDAEHPPWESVEKAVEAGRLCNMPVMVDFWPRPPLRPYPDLILEKLRPGDILGALTGDAGLAANDIGKIDVFATRAYVAISRALANKALERLRAGRIKGRNFRVRALA